MGVLRSFLGRTPKQPASEVLHVLSMVALRSTEVPNWPEIVRQFTSDWDPQCDQNFEQSPGQAAVLRFPEGSIMLGFMSMPIPWGDLEWPVTTAWAWPEARAQLTPHRSHVVVIASSKVLSKVQLSLWQTRALASVLHIADAAGVYVGDASLVVAPEHYIASALEASEEELPLFLWLSFHPVSDNGLWSLYTLGLPCFGLLNLEVIDSNLDAESLIEFVANVAHYELLASLQVGDGETVGSSEDERFQVVHETSKYGTRETICRIIP